MAAEINKRNIKICILAVAMIQMCFVGLTGAIADIAAYFPSYSVQVVQTGVNATNFMAIFGALFAGWLSYSRSKKALTILGLALVAAGGLGGFCFHDTIVLLYAWSLVIGAGLGLFTPPATSLMMDYFEGPELNRLAGWQTSFINGGGVILTFAGGALATIAWHFSYLSFLAALVILAVCALTIPMKNRFPAQKAEKQKIPRSVWYYCFTVFIFTLVYNAFMANIALFLSEKGLGNSSMAGAANAVFMIGGVCLGLVFNKFSKRFGEFLFGGAHIFMAVCFFMLCSSQSLIVIFIASFIGGSGISFTMPQSMYSVSGKIPPQTSAAVFSLIGSVAPSVGVFVSPTLIAFLSRLFSDTGDSVSRFMAAGMLAVVFAALQIVIVARGRVARGRVK